ncbi:MAG: pirin family protein [Pseudomonadota bacterium]
MKTSLRRSEDRGAADFGWLKSAHTFSFGRYFDSRHMGFGVLRVINEDRVEPGKGFSAHGHSDMEILSYVIEGELEHKDDMGNGSIIRPGDMQRMSAGTGVTHSEYNASKTDPVHFLQIWVIPEEAGIAPGYEQRHFPLRDREGQLQLLASREGRLGSVSLAQDVNIYSTLLDTDDAVTTPLRADRAAWIQLVRGTLRVNGQALGAGDGLALLDVNAIELKDANDAEVLIFDVPVGA